MSHLELEVNDEEVTCSKSGFEKNKIINPLLPLRRRTPNIDSRRTSLENGTETFLGKISNYKNMSVTP